MAGKITKEQIIEQEKIEAAFQSIAKSTQPVIDAFDKIAAKGLEISKSVGGFDNLKDLIKLSQQAAKNTEELTFNQKELANQAQKLAQLYARQEEFNSKYNRSIAEANKRLSEQTRWQKLKVQQNQSELNSYNQLNAQYQRVTILLNKMSAEYRENNERGKALTKTANELYAQLSKLDQATGRHQRSVGNYSKAFNGLQFQMQQIAREAPSLAYGPQMFIAAISNNLPMLQDEIGKVRRENELLRAEGKKGVPVWQQMAMGLFSWQTAAVTLVTAYMLFSKEINTWIAGISKGREAIDVLKKSQEEYNKTVLEGIGNAQKDVTTLSLLYNAAKDVNKSMEERNVAVSKLQEMYPKYFSNLDAEVIKAGQAGKAYEILKNRIIEAAKARAFSDQIAENSKKIETEIQPQLDAKLKELNEAGDRLTKLREKKTFTPAEIMGAFPYSSPIEAAKAEYSKLGTEIEALVEQYNVLDEANKKLTKGINISSLYDETINKETGAKGAGGNKYTALEQMQDLHKLQLEETAKYQQQLMGQSEYTADQIARMEADNAKELLIQRLTQIDKEKGIKGLSLEELAQLDLEYADKNKELQKTMTDYAIDEAKRLFKEREDAAKEISVNAMADTQHAIALKEIELNKQAALDIQRVANAKDAADQIRDIELALSTAILNMRKAELQAAINSGKLTVDDKKRYQEEIDKINVALSDKEIDASKNATKETTKDKKQMLRDMGDAVNEGAELFKTSYDAQMEYAQQAYERETQMAGDNIEEKILAERKYQKAQNEIRRKQDMAEKAQAIFNIGLTLFESMAELNPFKIAAATLAMASVLARPIPQYFKGTKNAEGTFIAGEKGSEAIIKPDGEVMLTPDKPTLFSDDAFKGSTILPHDKTMQMLQSYSIKHDSGMYVDLSKTNKHLETLVKNSSNQSESFIDARGNLVVKRGNITTHYASRTI